MSIIAIKGISGYLNFKGGSANLCDKSEII
jgi:hypothetical protein